MQATVIDMAGNYLSPLWAILRVSTGAISDLSLYLKHRVWLPRFKNHY